MPSRCELVHNRDRSFVAASLSARSAESWGMSALTRRRSDNPHRVTWHVYFDDVRVGMIGERAGVPVDVDQW
jgi:hypothetical protein